MKPINEKQILTFIERLLNFPYPTICRHLVCCDLLELLEQNGYKVSGELAKAVVEADDIKALKLLKERRSL